MIASFSPAGEEPVLVVGGGPAGATAARTLALAGIPVRLLDRAAFPRNKPCGGGISLRVMRRFPYLSGALPRIATHFVARLHLEGPQGESTLVESDGPAALMVRRLEFDALLVALGGRGGRGGGCRAPTSSVPPKSGGMVQLATRDGRTFESSTVIAADGVHSTIGRRLGLNPGWPATAVALDMMEETPRAALRDVDPSTLWVVVRISAWRRTVAESHGFGRLRVHLSEARSRQRRCWLCAAVLPRRKWRRRPTTCSGGSSTGCARAASSTAHRCARISRRF